MTCSGGVPGFSLYFYMAALFFLCAYLVNFPVGDIARADLQLLSQPCPASTERIDPL